MGVMTSFLCSSLVFGRKIGHLRGRYDLFFYFWLITMSGPAGLALKCPPPPFQISGHAPTLLNPALV